MNYIWHSLLDFTGLAGACYCVADYSFLVVRCCSSGAVFGQVYVDSKNRIAVAAVKFDSLFPSGIASLGERISECSYFFGCGVYSPHAWRWKRQTSC